MYEFAVSSEPYIEKCRSLARSKKPYLEVLDCRIRLAWKDGDATCSMKRADALGLNITYDMLEEALSEAGGIIDVNGRYPINNVILQRLRKLLNFK